MLKGFRDFLMRGNIIDLAVAVVIGAAFTAVVGSIAEYIIKPILAVFGGVDTKGFGFQLTSSSKTFVDLGAVFAALIQFLITAAVVYFVVVLPMRKTMELVQQRKQAQESAEAEKLDADIALLTEIRDLLKEGNSARLGVTGERPSNPAAPPRA